MIEKIESDKKRIREFIGSCESDFDGGVFDRCLVLQNNIIFHCVAKDGELQYVMYDDKLRLQCTDKENAVLNYNDWYWSYFQWCYVLQKSLSFPGRKTIEYRNGSWTNDDDVTVSPVTLLKWSLPKDGDTYWFPET